MIILLHSSKTMRMSGLQGKAYRAPQLITQSQELAAYLQTLSSEQLATAMHVSSSLAARTHSLIAQWGIDPKQQSLAVDSFVGDIYSGLRASDLSAADRDYADSVLRILSGLYGVIRPYDGICPYRLEMGYKLPAAAYADLYTFWGSAIAAALPANGLIVNVSSIEYTKTITPFVDAARVVTPRFLTIDQKTGQPAFVVVHAKIARGAFARWLITSRFTEASDFSAFNDIGYYFDQALSRPDSPVFVCQEFLGKGLSMRTA
jgi:cytoplasmic iron level regulating protein YaaA (DUF328/UPF0246 family)